MKDDTKVIQRKSGSKTQAREKEKREAFPQGVWSRTYATFINRQVVLLQRLLGELRADDVAPLNAMMALSNKIIATYKAAADADVAMGSDRSFYELPGAQDAARAHKRLQKFIVIAEEQTQPRPSVSPIVRDLQAADFRLMTFLRASRLEGEQNELEFRLEEKDPGLSRRSDLIAKIEAAWMADSSLASFGRLPHSVIEKAAAVAIEAAALDAAPDPENVEEFRDRVSGLVLPPKLVTPYRQRGHHEDGSRLSVFEHLQAEYPEYLKHKLLFSGHIQLIDRPAYQALLYLADKDAKEKKLPRATHTPDFLWQHGILTSEHLMNPPEGAERSAEVLRALQGKRKIAGVINSVTSKLEKTGGQGR